MNVCENIEDGMLGKMKKMKRISLLLLVFLMLVLSACGASDVKDESKEKEAKAMTECYERFANILSEFEYRIGSYNWNTDKKIVFSDIDKDGFEELFFMECNDA